MSRVGPLWRALAILVGSYLLLVYGFPPLMPRSLLWPFMAIIALSVLLYYSFDDRRWEAFKAPLRAFQDCPQLGWLRWLVVLLLPLGGGAISVHLLAERGAVPAELRQLHPAPPERFSAAGKSYQLAQLDNPFRTEVLALIEKDRPRALARYDQVVARGRDHYYQNCLFCHGDLLDGRGPLAPGLSPAPINFQDVGTIAQLEESFLFWRIATGGPGLPSEGTPWDSSMPAWHGELSDDDIWSLVTFLYDYVGQVPRIWDGERSAAVTAMTEAIRERRKAMRGSELYQFRCAVCHGEQGMGDGIAADRLYPRPRDFSLALFKFKTTPPQQLPTDDDLFTITKHGLRNSSMPGWGSLLSDAQIRSLLPVLKGFDTTAAWAPEGAEDEAFDEAGRYLKQDFIAVTEQEPLTARPPYDAASIALGREAFMKACNECHGDAGRGNITSGKRLADDWEQRIWPRDLTKPWSWVYTNRNTGHLEADRAATIEAIYRMISIGIAGTPMPAHRAVEEGNADPVSLAGRWQIANYVYSLREGEVVPSARGVLRARRVEGPLPERVDDPAWAAGTAVSVRLLPNVVSGERLYTPLNDAVTLRALYNDEAISFLLEVNDRTESRPGAAVAEAIQDRSLELYADALALEFPMPGASTTEPSVHKPSYWHGEGRRETAIWYWSAGSVEPPIAATTRQFVGSGLGRALRPLATPAALGSDARWQDGQWRVVLRRARHSDAEGGSLFDTGRYLPIAIANWDGSNGERGGRHTFSGWHWLLLEAGEGQPGTLLIPLTVTLLLALLLWGWLRPRRHP